MTTMNGTNADRSHSYILIAALAGVITGSFLMSAFTYKGRSDWPTYLIARSSTSSSSSTSMKSAIVEKQEAEIQRKAILHYATSKITPQQSYQEITLSLNVLRLLTPCNFLVFGLGHDSLMWMSFNPNGETLFLEEDPKWVETKLKESPFLNAKTVPYRTQLSEADHLLQSYKNEPSCLPSQAFLKGNEKCRLALENLPEEVYEKEWDVIMVDAPRGYFDEAPGRMAAIYSAAVMARARKRPGVTHVYLHDVNRKVEREFAKEFLCMKYKVGGVGRLWHFEIPPARDNNNDDKFC